MDSAYGAGINTRSAVDTGIGVDSTLRTLFADSVNWTRVLTSCTVCAIISNSMGHNFTSLLDWLAERKALFDLPYRFLNVQ
jgi:hypothetical protein